MGESKRKERLGITARSTYQGKPNIGNPVYLFWDSKSKGTYFRPDTVVRLKEKAAKLQAAGKEVRGLLFWFTDTTTKGNGNGNGNGKGKGKK